jgi:hypothetical protein
MKKAPSKTVAQPAPRLTAHEKCEAFGIEPICERIAECITLQVIADEIGVTKWDLLRFVNSDLHQDAHARARLAQADKHAADVLAISDEIDIEVKYDGDDVRLQLDATAVARNRLRVDTRKWLAAKMAPKRYGERQQVDVNDVTPPKPIDEVRARIAELMAKASNA